MSRISLVFVKEKVELQVSVGIFLYARDRHTIFASDASYPPPVGLENPHAILKHGGFVIKTSD